MVPERELRKPILMLLPEVLTHDVALAAAAEPLTDEVVVLVLAPQPARVSATMARPAAAAAGRTAGRETEDLDTLGCHPSRQ